MRLALVVCALLALLYVAHAVDRGNFKTCDQSSFCKRQRKYAEAVRYPHPHILARYFTDPLNTCSFSMLKHQTAHSCCTQGDHSARYSVQNLAQDTARPSRLFGTVIDAQNANAALTLDLLRYKEGFVRVQINEANEANRARRWEPKDVLQTVQVSLFISIYSSTGLFLVLLSLPQEQTFLCSPLFPALLWRC
jgi:hypothetical protein